MKEYSKAIQLIEDNGQEVRPEIYNNIGSLNIRRGDLEGAKKYLNMALEKVRSDIENQQGKWYFKDDQYIIERFLR